MPSSLHRLLASAIFLATPAIVQGGETSTVTIGHPFAYETAATAMSAGGYMDITNTGDVPDRLTGVEADFPRVMLHTTEMSGGIARMSHVEAIDIAPGETVSLAPGGHHIMFMGLKGDPFEAGEEIPVTLIFEHAGPVEVILQVEPRSATEDHGKHGS